MSSKRTSNEPQVATWSHEEDKCLARAWCTFRDGFKDTDPRKIAGFWKKVAKYYNENRPSGTQVRSWDAVNTHCFHMSLDVNMLSKVYETCYSDGASVDDVLEVALAQWRKKYSRDFRYAHVWKLMTELEIDRPQQSEHHVNKKSKTSESRSRTSSESEVRLCAAEQQMGKRQDTIKVKSCAIEKRGKMQQIQEERMKQRGIKLMHKDFDVIMLDTSGMTDAQREVHCKFVEQIRARRNW